MPRLLALLRAFGIVISKRQVVRLLIDGQDDFLNEARDVLRMWPRCVPAQSLRAFMSSIIRWRSGLMVSVLIGNSCLG